MNKNLEIVDTTSPTLKSNKNVVLITTALVGFFASFTYSGLNVALPSINQEYKVSAVLLSWVVSAYILTLGVLFLPFGRLADIIGIRKSFLIGLIVFTLGSLISIFSVSIPMLIGCQVLRAAAGAMIFGNSTALLTMVFSARERGRAYGINAAAMYSGLTIGPFLGGVLTERLGWRSIFIFCALTFLVIIYLVLTKIKNEWNQSKGENFDYIGAIIYGVALVAFMYGFSSLPQTYGIITGVAGTLGIGLFLLWENHCRVPILNLKLFRHNKPFILGNLSTFLNYSAVTAVVYLMSLYLQYIKGLNAEQAGLVLLCQPLMQTVFSLISGKLSCKVNSAGLSSMGMSLTFIGIIGLLFLSQHTPMIWIIISLLILGSGYGLFAAPNSNAVMSSIEQNYYGVGSATMGTVRSIGQIISMGIMTIVTNIFLGHAIITSVNYPAFLTSTRISFAVFGILCFAGIFTSFYQQNKPKSIVSST